MKCRSFWTRAGNSRRTGSAFWVLCLFWAILPAQDSLAAEPKFLSDRVAVKLENTGTPLDHRFLASQGFSVKRRVRRIPWVILKTAPGSDITDLAQGLSKRAEVVVAEPVFLRRAFAAPLDTYYADQWSLNETLGAQAAWERTTGLGAVVAVLDTGAKLDHVDLVTNLWQNAGEIPGDSIDNDGNGFVDDVNGFDTFDQDGDPSDDINPCTDSFGIYYPGHGTAVAGLIAGRRHELVVGGGIVGLAYGAKIMIVRVLGHFPTPPACGVGTTVSIAEGIIYAADQGAHILNLSLGGPGDSQMEKDAIEYALGKGSILVAASGNEGAADILFPARYLSVIAVGATDRLDGLADYSNIGKGLDLMAPGGRGLDPPTLADDLVVATYDPTPTIDGWAVGSGTSFSAPLVSALAALLVEQGWTDGEGLRLRMIQTAKDLRKSGWDEETGYGRIDVARATGVEVQPGTNPFVGSRAAFPENPIAYPNPFYPVKDPHCVLTFSAEARVEARVQIYDQENLLVWERILAASDVGAYNEIPWDGRNGRGNSVGTGVYIIVVKQGGRMDYGNLAVIGR